MRAPPGPAARAAASCARHAPWNALPVGNSSTGGTPPPDGPAGRPKRHPVNGCLQEGC